MKPAMPRMLRPVTMRTSSPVVPANAGGLGSKELNIVGDSCGGSVPGGVTSGAGVPSVGVSVGVGLGMGVSGVDVVSVWEGVGVGVGVG